MSLARSSGLVGFLVALTIHGAALGGLAALDPPARERPTERPRTTVRLTTRPAAPAPPAKLAPEAPPAAPKAKPVEPKQIVEKTEKTEKKVAEKKVAERKTEKKVAKKKTEKKVTKKKTEKKKVAATRTREQPREAARPAQSRRFAVSMSATVGSGGVAVPTVDDGAETAGDGRLGDPTAPADAPVGAREPGDDAGDPAAEPVHATQVTSAPRLLSQPSDTEMRKRYPDAARRDGVEANVELRLLVDRLGRVAAVRVVDSPDDAFAAAARALVRRFRFTPGRRGDDDVAVWIPWTYKFRLEG